MELVEANSDSVRILERFVQTLLKVIKTQLRPTDILFMTHDYLLRLVTTS